jgi:polyphosphate:AMP phosphotransferase
MFETVELGRKVGRKQFKAEATRLREDLLRDQRRVREAGIPVIVVFGGVDGAGKSEADNMLNEWMDPRWLVTHAYSDRTTEELERPRFWRYWRDLPVNGQIGIFLSGWYSRPLLDRVHGGSAAEFDEQLSEIVDFERTLADGGALIVKFWMHLSKSGQKRRFKALQKDPQNSWKVTERHWANLKLYDQFVEGAERLIMRTSTGHATWHLVEGADELYAGLAVGQQLHRAIEARLEEEARLHALPPEPAPEIAEAGLRSLRVVPDDEEDDDGGGPLTVLSALDMSRGIDRDVYRDELAAQQARLARLARIALERKVSTLLVFEGMDAGGKGGSIRRMTQAMDARNYQVIPIAAPTEDERAHHYLWRFWRHLPRAGRFTIFDRSWYGRVLVERIEGFATAQEWHRAYAEINNFEAQLAGDGIVLLKFWLHVTRDEQLRRFEDRRDTPYKAWKLTDEDWRNREKWDAYEVAAHEMVQRTSTRLAPWILVEGNDKRFARIKVIRAVCDALEARLGES